MTSEPNLPANPLSIELTLTHQRLWWHPGDKDGQPEIWRVSADVWDLDLCAEEERHVADIDLAIADLTRLHTLADSVVLGEWVLEFIGEAVAELAQSRLHADLEATVSDGPPRIVILRRVLVSEPWRGHGLGAALIAGALRTFAPAARLAACSASSLDVQSGDTDQVSAELTSARLGKMLERAGFRRWHRVYVVDLNDPGLTTARTGLLNEWWPPPQG